MSLQALAMTDMKKLDFKPVQFKVLTGLEFA